jgi:hypothetical protein
VGLRARSVVLAAGDRSHPGSERTNRRGYAVNMPRTCEIIECERVHHAKGFCLKHYNAQYHAAALRRPLRDHYETVRRFGWAETDSGCWEYLGWLDKDGYGMLPVSLRVSRIVWEYHNDTIPKGWVVRHTCDNPPCVNPDHLLIGTVRDNSRDMVERGRHREQRKTHCPNGHPLEGDNLRRRVLNQGPRGCAICQRQHVVERDALVRAAASSLGLSQRAYAARYGKGLAAAREVLECQS